MGHIDDILKLLDEHVAAANAGVVDRAFRRASVRCPDCDYPQNAERFARLLDAYVSAKLRARRVRLDLERHYYGIRIDARELSLNADLADALLQARRLRDELEKIWPCEACLKRFNPVGRHRLPKPSLPKEQGLIHA